MSKTAHTPGRVNVSGCRAKIGKYTFHTLAVYDEKAKRDEVIAEVYFDERTGLGLTDAHRLRDCWNACEGIADPSVVPEAIQMLRDIAEGHVPHGDLIDLLSKLDGVSS